MFVGIDRSEELLNKTMLYLHQTKIFERISPRLLIESEISFSQCLFRGQEAPWFFGMNDFLLIFAVRKKKTFAFLPINFY